MELDVRALARELDRTVRGEVRFDEGSRALYSTDASNYRQVPIGVVLPKDAEDVVAAVAVCRRFDAPVLPRGGGTSLAGQCCNVAVVLDMSRHMTRVLEIDPGRRLARVEPGAVLDDLRARAELHHLTFGPDPATHAHCTLGGMIGNNSCGVHSLLAGKTDDNVVALEILTYDGDRFRVGRTGPEELAEVLRQGGRRAEIYRRLNELSHRYAELIRERYPPIPRCVSGYNLPRLLPENGFDLARALVGSEGTCALVLEATLRLVPSPPERTLLAVAFPDVAAAADAVPRVLRSGPIGLEGMDGPLIEAERAIGLLPPGRDPLPPGNGWLLVEFGGRTREDSDSKARRLMAELSEGVPPPSMRIYSTPSEQGEVWALRGAALGATAHVPGRALTWEGWEDSAVAPERLGEYLRRLRRLIDAHGYSAYFYGHFGQGCLHTRIDFDLESVEGVGRYRAFVEQAADLVLSLGGSLSGEHGDGQSRGELLPRMFGPELVEAFREFKAIWDPLGRMNPGKLVDALPLDANLRVTRVAGAGEPSTHFAFPEDGGSFRRATLRCVGVGDCRRTSGGTMCPSYRVTREEAHSTRGRARLLYEMIGGGIAGGWRDERVREALDLCLACKGCKGDCPVHVDVATYKAEFLSHYYEGRLRPRSAYSMGLVAWWSRLAGAAPAAANFLTQTPGIARLTRLAGGIAPDREIPRFARESFREWFRRRPGGERASLAGREPRPPVLLWPDTFNDHFNPEIARAAVRVLEACGFAVTLPGAWACCGRPLYDSGMLGLARRHLRRTLRVLREEIRREVPVVVLEPSCASVFRDELVNLLAGEPEALRLSRQTFYFAEFLQRHANGFPAGPLTRRALVQPHCHQNAMTRLAEDRALFARLGLDFEILDAGCCGMAGAFGFERGEHAEVSRRCGEQVLLPRVRASDAETLLIADGFSCREQIRQETGRRAVHSAQVLALACSDTESG